MANRIIKDSIRTSKSVNSLSDFEFRLWLYLITYVDDFGRGSADPELLKGLVFPRRKGVTEKQIQTALYNLANTGMVILYENDDEPFFYFPKWDKHQRIQSKHPKYPAPPPDNGESRLVTVSHGESPPESNPIQIELKSESELYKGAERADMSPLEEALDKFAKHRKALRKPLTPEARELTLKELEKLAPGDEAMQIAIINQSIQRGWQGVFPLKEETRKADSQREVSNNVFANLAREEGLL